VNAFCEAPFPLVWKPKKKPARASKGSDKRHAPLLMPGALSGELSAYEQAREENIKVLHSSFIELEYFKKKYGTGTI
jgi:hypothetical protein